MKSNQQGRRCNNKVLKRAVPEWNVKDSVSVFGVANCRLQMTMIYPSGLSILSKRNTFKEYHGWLYVFRVSEYKMKIV